MKATLFFVLICCFSVGYAAEPAPFTFPRSTPEAQGIASSAILDFVERADRELPDMNSFMLVRHGHVVAEGWWTPYDAATRHQLYLQKGRWNGKQLLPASWVEAATSQQISNGSNPESDWNQGYGFQFWRSRNNCYRGDGAFGQYCIVMPAQDAVVAITSGVQHMQAVLDLVWEKLLPAMQQDPLPVAADANEKLQCKLATLVVPVQDGAASSALAKTTSGQ